MIEVISQEEFDNLQPGDKVRVVSEWNDHSCENCHGYMDKYLGMVVTVEGFRYGSVQIEEDKNDPHQRWSWGRHCFCEVISPKEYVGASEDELNSLFV